MRLLCAKTKVAPIKSLTIPKLELLGAHLLSRLMSRVSTTLELPNKFYWCDSQIVFIKNRIAEIQNSTKTDFWNYIKSLDNRADIPSRGLNTTGHFSREFA